MTDFGHKFDTGSEESSQCIG